MMLVISDNKIRKLLKRKREKNNNLKALTHTHKRYSTVPASVSVGVVAIGSALVVVGVMSKNMEKNVCV